MDARMLIETRNFLLCDDPVRARDTAAHNFDLRISDTESVLLDKIEGEPSFRVRTLDLEPLHLLRLDLQPGTFGRRNFHWIIVNRLQREQSALPEPISTKMRIAKFRPFVASSSSCEKGRASVPASHDDER